MPSQGMSSSAGAAAGVSRPPQIGSEPTRPRVARDRTAAHQHFPREPSHSESHTGNLDVSDTAECPVCNVTNTVRKYPEHFCGWEKCCYKFYGKGGLLAKSFDHLPVCHSNCWKDERDRLGHDARRDGNWPRASLGLPSCHRECYMRTLFRRQNPEAGDREVVPRSRDWKERLRVPKIEHWMAKAGVVKNGNIYAKGRVA